MLTTWAHLRAVDVRGPMIDEDTEPMDLGADVPLAAVQQMQEAVEAAVGEATWELAVPSGNA